MNHFGMIKNPKKGKELSFFPREKMFWLVNILAWVFMLDRINIPGNSYHTVLETEHPLIFKMCLIYVWLAYIVVGTLMVLCFRHFYYRKQWGERKLVACFPLAILLAAATGLTMSFLVQLPVDGILNTRFLIYQEGGEVFISEAFTYALWRSLVLAILCLLWLLAYWGISASLNSRELAFKTLALENNLKGAKLNALSGQINSHFLFNALNNIRFMIATDAQRAEDSLVALSEILRHSLETSRKGKVPIAEELEITEKYLGLMHNQMQNRLKYSIQADPEADACLIPPMIVQMLVENAIKHGIDQISEGGRVAIKCLKQDAKLRIEVSNTAKLTDGEAQELIQKLHMEARGEKHIVTDSEKGVGLANISNRLALLYGAKAEMTMSYLDNEFVVLIELPCEQAK